MATDGVERGSPMGLRRFLEPASTASPVPDLRRFLEPKPRPAPGERCEFCTEILAPAHSHVVDVEGRSLRCACRACWFLFASDGAAGGRYRSVPERYQHDEGFLLTDAQWETLQIPVGMAFFFVNSVGGDAVAFYPSPAGATESLLPIGIWQDLTTTNLMLQGMAPDVEALLVRRERGGPRQAFLVPIDACYELVGIIRRTWKGFDGGQEAHDAIDGFFADIAEKSRSVVTGRTS
ncbi:MAG: DUF5947 family protein [Candidatus Limnocylindrales bacterium]